MTREEAEEVLETLQDELNEALDRIEALEIEINGLGERVESWHIDTLRRRQSGKAE